MLIHTVLYLHLLAATAWIGGSLFLFMLGIFIRDKQEQIHIYDRIGPLYGYSESFWLVLLWISGLILFFHFNIDDVFRQAPASVLAAAMTKKLYIVILITLATMTHMYISFKAPLKKRSVLEKMVSRASSLLIFLLNLLIIWVAISLRTLLT